MKNLKGPSQGGSALGGKKILILGFAREGLSSLRFLARNKVSQDNIFIADQKQLNQFEPEYKKYLKKFDKKHLNLGINYLKDLDKFDLVIKTAGIKLKKKNVKLTTNLNIFLENIKGQVIGITGTKGKSTTASLIYSILNTAKKKVVLVGNIGKPFLDYLSKDSKDTIFVAELSSHQLDTLEGKFNIGVFTSFFPEHLTYHGSLKKYWQAKMNLVKNSKIVVVNKKIPVPKASQSDAGGKNIKRKKITYGSVNIKSNLLGKHNQENIGATIKVVELFKIKKNIVNRVIEKFKPLEHRLEYAGKYKGIDFYNDVLSTTPESTIEAIDALKGKNLTTIIVGGHDRGLDYKKLVKKIIQAKIKNVIYWPHAGENIARQLKGKTNLIKVKDMKETVKAAYKCTPPHSAVLLSPAASSYDYYQDYRQKGEEFKRLIKKL